MRVRQTRDLDGEERRLEGACERNVPQVYDPGDFAVRGALPDVYPMGADMPFRVELFDDVIDTMRGFDPETQRSLDKLDAVQLLPGREVPLDRSEEHTSELQSLMRTSYALFCSKKKNSDTPQLSRPRQHN